MKKIILLFISSISIQAYAQWVQISTVPTTQLNAVKFFDVNTGIAVGANGIWRSINSGVNWVQVLSSSNLNAVSFPDNNNGFAVGDSGKIFKTTNNGLNWNQIGIGLTTKKLNGVSFPSGYGWVVGESGKILFTYNNGNNFVIQAANDTIFDINYIQMINSTTGYICGSSTGETFGFTPNGGINWLYNLFMGGNNLNAVSYIPSSGNSELAVGTNGRIRRTTNNGLVWTIITTPVSVQLNHVVFLDANTGYIAGNAGNILKTTNSGFNWMVDAVVTSENLRSIYFINSATAWVVGSNGVVIRTGIPVAIQSEAESLRDFKLSQNYPNPFNPVTSIVFELPTNSFVQITVYDMLGNEIRKLTKGIVRSGRHELLFDATDLTSGVYIYKLEINSNFSIVKKMVLIK